MSRRWRSSPPPSAAIRREPPDPLARQRSEAVRAAVCPNRGLQPFREEDEPFFFGRSNFAETLTASVLRHPFVAIVGASGSGKSSVVRAGLIPRLRRGAGHRIWDAVTLVPTDRPLTSLAAALLPLLEPDLSEVKRLAEVADLADHLRTGRIELRDVARRVLAKQPGTDRLLVFIDQWEEVYTLGHDADAREAFVGQLLKATAGDAIRVVVTIRGDFMGRVLEHRDLSDRLQDGLVTIGPMKPGELGETIVKPAAKAGLRFEPGLPETILDDLGDEPGKLPLLEFLLEGLWARRRGDLLTHDAYVELERVSGAIAKRADEVFERLTDSERQAAQRLLTRMVRLGEGVEDTRRRAVLREGDAVVDATIRKLADERLVVTERDRGSGAVMIEVAHEALIRHWHRLRAWIEADREFLRTRDRIALQARLWEDDQRPPERLLRPGRPLAEGKDLLVTRRTDLDPELIAYIEESAKKAEAEKEAAAAVQRRRVHIARLIAAAMAVLAVVAFAGGAFAWWQRGEAQRSAGQAQRNESRALASLAEGELERGSPATAVRLALAAMPMRLDAPDRHYARAAEGALLSSVQHLCEGARHLCERRRFHHEAGVSSVAFSPNGRMLATGSEDHTARLWEVATGKELAVLRSHEGVLSVAFSPDGRTLATGSSDDTARLWEVTKGTQIAELHVALATSVFSVAFSPDGRTLATGSRDTARLWEVATGKQIAMYTVALSPVSSVAFSPDGRTLVTGADDKTARMWEVATGKEIAVLRGHEWPVFSVTFSPDGRTLATGSGDRTARLWDVASGKEIATFRGHEEGVASIAFSPDGRTLVTGGAWDKTARLWEVASGKEVAVLRVYQYGVASIAFSPDGRTLAIGSGDKTIRLWDVASGKEIAAFSGHEEGVLSVAFSADGRMLATGSQDKTARLWPVGQHLVDLACARVHDLPLSEPDKERFGITHEWCTPEVSGALRAKLGLDAPAAATASAR